MRYTIYINQQKAIEWGLNLPQAAMFNFCYGLQSWADNAIFDNKVYYFASRNMITNEVPLISAKPDTAYRLLKSIQKIGLINYIKIGKKDYISITKKGSSWNKTELGNISELENKDGNISEITRKYIRNSSEIFPTYNNSILDNNSILSKEGAKSNNNDNFNNSNVEHISNSENGISLPKDKKEKKKEVLGSTKRKEIPKSENEVFLYLIDEGIPYQFAKSESEKFHDYFESNGWKVGGRSAMKDWRAAIRGWMRRTEQYNLVEYEKNKISKYTLENTKIEKELKELEKNGL